MYRKRMCYAGPRSQGRDTERGRASKAAESEDDQNLPPLIVWHFTSKLDDQPGGSVAVTMRTIQKIVRKLNIDWTQVMLGIRPSSFIVPFPRNRE